MLIIKTEVRPSSIHGLGLFAAENLQQGQIIWVLHKKFDCTFTKSEWDLLPCPARTYLHTYMYWSSRLNKYVACLDNSRHMNHCESPNTESIYFDSLAELSPKLRDSARMTPQQWELVDPVEGFVITTKAVAKDEELSCNYHVDFPDYGGAGTLDFLGR